MKKIRVISFFALFIFFSYAAWFSTRSYAWHIANYIHENRSLQWASRLIVDKASYATLQNSLKKRGYEVTTYVVVLREYPFSNQRSNEILVSLSKKTDFSLYFPGEQCKYAKILVRRKETDLLLALEEVDKLFSMAIRNRNCDLE